jgi:hypothetical protein
VQAEHPQDDDNVVARIDHGLHAHRERGAGAREQDTAITGCEPVDPLEALSGLACAFRVIVSNDFTAS